MISKDGQQDWSWQACGKEVEDFATKMQDLFFLRGTSQRAQLPRHLFGGARILDSDGSSLFYIFFSQSDWGARWGFGSWKNACLRGKEHLLQMVNFPQFDTAIMHLNHPCPTGIRGYSRHNRWKAKEATKGRNKKCSPNMISFCNFIAQGRHVVFSWGRGCTVISWEISMYNLSRHCVCFQLLGSSKPSSHWVVSWPATIAASGPDMLKWSKWRVDVTTWRRDDALIGGAAPWPRPGLGRPVDIEETCGHRMDSVWLPFPGEKRTAHGDGVEVLGHEPIMNGHGQIITLTTLMTRTPWGFAFSLSHCTTTNRTTQEV